MKVKIMQRSVYHKYTEVEIEVPNLIDYESEIHEYLLNNDDLWMNKLSEKNTFSKIEEGSGVDDYEGMNEPESDMEWRFDIVGKQYGGHL